MLTTLLRAIVPALRDDDDERLTLIRERDDVPQSLADGHGDFACGHCGPALLRGELADRLNADGAVEANAQALPVRCRACGWDNEVPRG